MKIIIFIGVFAVLYFLWCQTIRWGIRNLRCSRSFSRPAVFAGEEAELVEIVGNYSGVIIPWLLVESKISPHLRFGKQDNLHSSGNMHYCSQFTLMPYQQVHRRHRVRFLHRGSYNLGNASLSIGDIIGLAQYQRLQTLDVPVLVYPALIPENKLPQPMSNFMHEVTRTPQLMRDPFLIRGLRPYQPGDPVRDIHWAATARTGDVQVRIHDYTARTRFLVVLNCQIHDRQWHDQFSDEDAELIEQGISLAATACVKAIREGVSVGFATNMAIEGESDSVVMLPTDGGNREEMLLAVLAKLQVHRTEPILFLLEELQAYSGMDVLIISAYDSADLQTAAQKLRSSGNQVLIQLLEGDGVCKND